MPVGLEHTVGFPICQMNAQNRRITVSFFKLDYVANKSIEQNSFNGKRFHGAGDIHKQ